MYNMATFFHEVGHLLDPALLRDFMKTLADIKAAVPFVPIPRKELMAAYNVLTDKRYTDLVFTLVQSIMNIGLDAHDEEAISVNYSAMVGRCLRLALGVDKATHLTLQQMRAAGCSEMDIRNSLIFEYIRFGGEEGLLVEDTDDKLSDPAYLFVQTVKTPLDVLRFSDDADARRAAAFEVFAALWPVILQEMQDRSSPPPQQSPSSSDEGAQGGEGTEDGQDSDGSNNSDSSRSQNGNASKPDASNSGKGNSDSGPSPSQDSSGAAGNDGQQKNDNASEAGSQTGSQESTSEDGKQESSGSSGAESSSEDRGGSQSKKNDSNAENGKQSGSQNSSGNTDKTDSFSGSNASDSSNGSEEQGSDVNGNAAENGPAGQQETGSNAEKAGNGKSSKPELQSRPEWTPDPDVISDIVKQIKEIAQSFETKTPEKTAGKSIKVNSNSSGKDQDDRGEEMGRSAFEKVLQQHAASKAEELADKEVNQGTDRSIKGVIKTLDATSPHKNLPVYTHRSNVTPELQRRYEQLESELHPVRRRLVEAMRRMFEELRDGATLRKRSYGRIDAKNFQRVPTDQKFFMKKKAPQDVPHLAICVVVDRSGSMTCGEECSRIYFCCRAAILLEGFASDLDIPIMVCGHNKAARGINFYISRDFEAPRRSKRVFALADTTTSGCNRDGYAFLIASELLAKRPEEDKLLIILSDGCPNDDYYGGDSAAEDIRNILKRAERKYGIETIACAFGDSKEQVKEIYGSKCLDISDLSTLPRTLTKIVRERLEE